MSTSDEAERAFDDQDEDEIVEINPDGSVQPANPQESTKGAAIRDSKGEY